MNKPPYSEYPTMAAEEILLRRISSEEISEIISISFYDGNQATTEAEALAMLNKIELDYLNGESVHWGIIERNSGKLIGTCGFYRGFENASGELGCILLPEFGGKGYMTEALRLAVAFGFRNLGLKRIFALTSHENTRAKKLLERLNFSRTAAAGEEVQFEVLRENYFSIKKYKNENLQQVLRLLRLNIPQNFHPSEEKDLQIYLEKEAQHYFIAEGLGSILAAGGYNCGFDEGRTVRISWDMVHPEFQGLGIGRELTLFRIGEIKKDSRVEKIVVRTTSQAEKFYQKLGFQKVHFEEDFWAPGFDLCQMEMQIK